ncbi:hypothetical protein BS78_05G054700 [Paspalum vaginatum]|nr:hypothetical protein BS78_05G054700 [Paspalum vaginatum]
MGEPNSWHQQEEDMNTIKGYLQDAYKAEGKGNYASAKGWVKKIYAMKNEKKMIWPEGMEEKLKVLETKINPKLPQRSRIDITDPKG